MVFLIRILNKHNVDLAKLAIIKTNKARTIAL